MARGLEQVRVPLLLGQHAALRDVKVPLHVTAFADSVEAPTQDGEQLARLILIPGTCYFSLQILISEGKCVW
jgi:hypothetical protein